MLREPAGRAGEPAAHSDEVRLRVLGDDGQHQLSSPDWAQ